MNLLSGGESDGSDLSHLIVCLIINDVVVF